MGRGGAEGMGPFSWDFVSERGQLHQQSMGELRVQLTYDLTIGLNGVHDGRATSMLSSVDRSVIRMSP